jgi:hypothetical protein
VSEPNRASRSGDNAGTRPLHGLHHSREVLTQLDMEDTPMEDFGNLSLILETAMEGIFRESLAVNVGSHSMFDEVAVGKVVWDVELQHDIDSHDLLHHVAHGGR